MQSLGGCDLLASCLSLSSGCKVVGIHSFAVSQIGFDVCKTDSVACKAAADRSGFVAALRYAHGHVLYSHDVQGYERHFGACTNPYTCD
jgi:hypothetical protein